ncbi:Selenocysteine-specific translation elongation factor [Sulfitobacter guttiformis KCTC 32187]|nr:Selenocysteine-specific translation elongation factor [Sulfitobacter guttiformis KCTC 32187]
MVIGHVDHGKSALVRALTGTETDSLPEEKQRGLSITPGYAHRSYPAGVIDFVDAPGHEDFIAAMVAGASGARAALLVISAREGIAAQTLEHLRIAQLLGIETGIIAITKSDLVETAEQDLLRREIRAALAHSVFATAPIIFCSALTGDGLDSLNDALESVLKISTTQVNPPSDSFLPIDRIFTLAGLGTVVTGTLLGADLTTGGEAVVLPEGRKVSIRGLHSRGLPRETVHTGERTAANLRGVAVADIARGSVLCAAGSYAPSVCIDVEISLLPDAPAPLKHNQDLRVLFGTAHVVANLRIFGGDQLRSKHSAFAQLRFKRPVAGFAGQRAILRQLSPAATLGGAVFLDPLAAPARAGDASRIAVLEAASAGDPCHIAHALCTSASAKGIARLSDVARLSRKPLAGLQTALLPEFDLLEGDLIAPHSRISGCKAEIIGALATYHIQFPLHLAAARTILAKLNFARPLLDYCERVLIDNGDILEAGAGLTLEAHDPLTLMTDKQHSRMAEMITVFRAAGLSPPAAATVVHDQTDADLLALCIDTRALTALHNVGLDQRLVLDTQAVQSAAVTLLCAFPPPHEFTTSAARSALETSRRVIVPLLEHFDTCAITLRSGDTRRMAKAISVPTHDAN